MWAFRFIVIVLLAYLVFVIVDVFLLSLRTRGAKRNRIRAEKDEQLVLCIQCESYLPEGEAIFSHGNYFCKEECVRLFESTA